jgi:DNA anti-recombination protein RmuC
MNDPSSRNLNPASCRITDTEPEKFPMLTRDEYVAKMKQRLDKWSAEMDALEAKTQNAQEDAKVKAQEQMSTLQAMRLDGEKKLEEIKSATEDSWEHLKTETEKVWDAFKDSVQAFKSHYK